MSKASSRLWVRCFVGALVAGLLAAGTVARAQNVLDAPAGGDPYRRLAFVEGQLAIDGPLGIFGIAAGIMPIRYFAIDVGGGVGRDGYRLGAGLRGIFPSGHNAFGLRLGVATGPETWDYGTYRRVWDSQVFLNAEVSYEYRPGDGFMFRAVLGAEDGVGSPTRCSSNDAGSAAPTICAGAHPARPYFGISVGYAFGGENMAL